MEVYCIVNQTVDLEKPTRKIQLQQPLAYDNALAHAMQVTAVGEDGPVSLQGCVVVGKFTPAGGNTLTPLTGSVTGENVNVAQVILPSACYKHPGRFKFTMNLSKNGTTRTVLWVEGFIERNETDTIEAPTEVIDVSQTIADASAAGERAEAAAAAAEAFTDAIAPQFADLMAENPFEPLTAYAQHCWHEGTLYVNSTDIDTAETWNAAHWEAVDVSGELFKCLKQADVATAEDLAYVFASDEEDSTEEQTETDPGT